MRYEAMGQNRAQRLDVPRLAGGLNTAAEPSLIEDDELAAVCNFTMKHGALQTRRAVCAVGDAPLTAPEGQNALADKILRQTIDIGGEACTVIITSASHQASGNAPVTVQVVGMDGVCRNTYTMTSLGAGDYAFAIVPSDPKTHGGAFLLYHANGVYVPNDENGTMEPMPEDKLYAPLVMINGKSIGHSAFTSSDGAMANGVMYEGFNALTRRYRAQFTSDVGSVGESDEISEFYALPTALDPDSALTFHAVTASGEGEATVKVGTTAEKVSLGTIGTFDIHVRAEGVVAIRPPLPKSTISGTVTVTCSRKANPTEGMVTTGAGLATWFGGTQNKLGGTRLFLGGFNNAKLMWSDANNPLYFPENNYMYVGDLSQRIIALEKQGDMLVIFKEREMFYTTYVQGEIDASAIENGINVDVTATQAYFPLTQLSPNIGCRCKDSVVLCRNRLVWMDRDARVYTLVVSGAYSERNVREIGGKIRPFLLENTTQAQRERASAIDHEGKYRVMIGKWMAEFDYSETGFVNVAGYASGEKAARQIAWFVHRYDGFSDTATQTLVSDGGDAGIMISTDAVYPAHRLVRMAYVFTDNDRDRFVRFDNTFEPIKEERPIEVTLTTKTYTFGDAAAFKRINAFFPILQADKATLRFCADGHLPTSGRAIRSDCLLAHLVIPGVKRCQTLAIRFDATGTVRIKGLRLQYTPFGTVR